MIDQVIKLVLSTYPSVQAVYLFGSWGTPEQTSMSDLDIAFLLPPEDAKSVSPHTWLHFSQACADLAGVESADLVNLRTVDTVFQYQITTTAKRIYTGDEVAADEFELTVMALYNDLSIQRAGIIREGVASGRFYGDTK